jgi:hypothetical protein
VCHESGKHGFEAEVDRAICPSIVTILSRHERQDEIGVGDTMVLAMNVRTREGEER